MKLRPEYHREWEQPYGRYQERLLGGVILKLRLEWQQRVGHAKKKILAQKLAKWRQ